MPTSTTRSQDMEFITEVINNDLLENSLSWIANKFSPEDVFDDMDLREWALDNMSVADFPESNLEDWAKSNGFIKSEE